MSTSWPTGGAHRRRSSAARATTTAVTPSTPALASRVARLPRRSANVRSGRALASCTRRRADPVATVAPVGSPSRLDPTRTSRGSPRSGKAASTRSGATSSGEAGRSLAECTAASASPRATAACTSVTNTPWPPNSARDTSVRRSPSVSTTTNSASTSTAARRAATRSACQRARGEPRVASRRRPVGEVMPDARAPVRGRTGRAGTRRAAPRAGCRRPPSGRPSAGGGVWPPWPG